MIDRKETGPRVAFATLGCKMNQSESAAMLGLFCSRGYQPVPFGEQADVYVIHTCTVTGQGDQKCRRMVRRAIRRNPAAKVVVTGCYAQVAPDEVAAIPGVNLVIGTKDRSRIVELVEETGPESSRCLVTPWLPDGGTFEELPLDTVARARAMVRIQEGCEGSCSYCIVPRARGPLRSRSPESARSEVKRLIEAGYREIVLTGVNLGAYGRDLGYITLADLVRDLAALEGMGRLRLSSIEPDYFTDDLVDAVTTLDKVCPHFHIPLQSGDDSTLERMRRRYRLTEYQGLLNRLRRSLPGCAVTTDVIVGFPGESETSFENSYRFVEAMAFSRLHVFPYSPRRGTPAASMPGQVPSPVKHERSTCLRQLGKRMAEDYAGRFVGDQLAIVAETIETGGQGRVQGHTGNYLLTAIPGDAQLIGKLVPVKITARNGDRLMGEQAGEPY